MFISDVFIKRPVFAAVVSLLLITFGIVSYTRLSLREYPDIDPPVVSISVNYPGASASIVESRVTEVIENRISGVSGISFIESSSEDGRSRITLEFNVGVDIEAAKGIVNFKIESKELLDSVIVGLAEKAKLTQRGDAYYRKKPAPRNP